MKKLREVMTTDLSVCSADDTLTEAAKIMTDHNVGAVPVCGTNRELLGMITDRDLVVRGLAREKSPSTKISDVMSGKLYSVAPDTSVQEASSLMAEKQIRRLPVVENGKLAGIVSLGDLALEEKSNLAAGHALEEISERPELH
ncbi:CBS domain-containing protein [Sediminibacillus dalangtanensis]|uniref:CBS domain-containing protein n=1 Tax=Sediminibacillus dalangtanensis TaxID=2729421 RepID=A0ABX7VS03_9BACI|nr:CBS domain-containing protein [Sediminibacillus dalangtanensis]QTM99308.1 CBS domain-containing protein [Sediminibacillus dalangtanensis]